MALRLPFMECSLAKLERWSGSRVVLELIYPRSQAGAGPQWRAALSVAGAPQAPGR